MSERFLKFVKLFLGSLISGFCFAFLCVSSYSLKADSTAINKWYTFNNSISYSVLGNYEGMTFFVSGNLKESIPFTYQTYDSVLDQYSPQTTEYISTIRGFSVYYVSATNSISIDLLYSFVYSLNGQIIDGTYTIYNTADGWYGYSNGQYYFKTYVLYYFNVAVEDNCDLLDFLSDCGLYTDNFENVPPSSMRDLIFTYVDIIPRTIQSMTSFEILGFSLFAMLGTFVLIVLIVKILKGGL